MEGETFSNVQTNPNNIKIMHCHHITQPFDLRPLLHHYLLRIHPCITKPSQQILFQMEAIHYLQYNHQSSLILIIIIQQLLEGGLPP